MIESVELVNFRKHRNLKLEFGPGLNAIRGANEQGKTTIIECILYAIFGSDALRESLSEVVTDGENEATLRAIVILTYSGTRYVCARKKSGATITYQDKDGKEQLVTGQTETKRFMENLFGCTAQLASLLMHADQNSVRGIISKGDTESGTLIEKLAKLEAIDALITKVQKQLPTGNTSAYEDQIAGLQNAVSIPELPTKAKLEGLSAEIAAIQAESDASDQARIADSEVVKAKGAIQAINSAKAVLAHLQQKQRQLTENLAKPLPIWDVTAEQVAQAELLIANEGLMDKRRRAYATAFPKTSLSWDEGEVKFYARIAELEDLETRATKFLNETKVERAAKNAKLIKEKTCALCQKDLSDVPEVVTINQQINDRLSELDGRISATEAQLKEHKEELTAMRKLKTVHEDIKKLAQTDYWAIEENSVPARPLWIGEVPPEAGTLPDVTGMRNKLKKHQELVMQQGLWGAELVEIKLPVIADEKPHQQILEVAELQKQQKQEIENRKQQKANELAFAKVEYDNAVAAHKVAVEKEASRLVEIEKLKDTIKKVNKNNSVIKNLRAARPKVVAELWGMLMTIISTHFTRMRGTDGVVTRAESGFKVNGRPIKRLSGSTQDILGLATRIALSKVFLPNVPFMFLDESFAGCDDTRELAGLNTLTVSGIPQTIFVTHSAAPETIADKLLLI